MSSRGKTSICWKLFTARPDRQSAVCDLCKTEKRYCKNSTTNFMRHLRRFHPMELEAYEAPRTALVTAMESVDGQQAASTSAAVSASTSAHMLSAPSAPAVRSTTTAPATAALAEQPRPSKQLTMEAIVERTIKYKPGSARKRELDACVLGLITTDLQPLSVVENKAFRRLMKKNGPTI